MDTDDNTFLNYFGDKPQSFLIQNSDETLGLQYSSLGVEQIFTDINDGSSWTIDGMPILMNGSLLPEGKRYNFSHKKSKIIVIFYFLFKLLTFRFSSRHHQD